MSLIHDALKSMDAPQEPKPAMVRAPAVAARGRPAWLDAVLAFAVVVGVGVLGWWLWQTQRQPQADMARVAAVPANPAATPPLPAETAPPVLAVAAEPTEQATQTQAAMTPSPPVGAAPLQQAPLSPAPETSTTPVVAAEARSEVQKAPVRAAPRPAPVRRVRPAPPVDSAAAAPAVDDTPVELRFARFVVAMKESRSDDAERELAALRERLPAGSLGLLRAQAWFDLRAGRDAAAEGGYRAILERMPGDEEAAINLASIQSRQQKSEEARATLDAAARLRPDSAALRAALAQFTPMARQ